ncbi:MAG: TonB-dependent receptor [Chitinivibrionales bacterium]|nr:TonB-dependent receptor [Chitinivibrionales bacterium]
MRLKVKCAAFLAALCSALWAAPADTTSAGPPAQDTLPPIETMPVLKNFVRAEYPSDLVKKGVEGTVLMDLVINDSGHVDSVAVTRGLVPTLDSNALTAARQFVFTPAQAGGKPVPVLMEYAYHFTLSDVIKNIDEFVNFKGRLIELGTRKPMSNATIIVSFSDTGADTTLQVPFNAYLEKIGAFTGQTLQERSLLTQTDSLGYFAFKSLPLCSVFVRIIAPEYEDFKDRDRIKPGEALNVTYRLQRLSYADNEIVVYGKAEKKEVAKETLTLKEVQRIPGLGGDAVKVVQALPGVARPSFMSGAVIVRGAPTWDSRFYLDGVPIPQLYHFGGIKSTYNSDALETVNFYPGGFGVRYGGGIAGVIEIDGRKAKTDRWHGYFDGNGFDASAMVEAPVTPKISVLAEARRSYIGDILGAVINLLKIPITVAPYYWDYILRTDISFTKDENAFVTFFGSHDQLDLIISAAGRNRGFDSASNAVSQSNIFNMGIAGIESRLSPRLTNSLRYSLNFYNQSLSLFGFMKYSVTGPEHYLRDELAWQWTPWCKLAAGADLNAAILDVHLKIPAANNTIISEDSLGWLFGDYGAYVNAEFKPDSRLSITPGLRYDYYPHLNYNGGVVPEFWQYTDFNNHRGISGDPSARLNARYTLAPNHVIKGAAGNYNQPPQPIGQTTDKTWGNPLLKSTKASQVVGGYEWQISDLLSLDAQTYYNWQWNVPRQPSAAEIAQYASVAEAPKYLDNGKRRMQGLELMLRHNQGQHFFGWVAYTLSRSEEYDFSLKKYVLYSSDQTHNLQLIGSWQLPHNWEIGARLRYVSGNPTTPILDRIWNNTSDRYRYEYGQTNSGRLDPFMQADLRVDKKFIFPNWILSLYLDVQNISWFFYKSPEYSIPNYDGTEHYIISSPIYPSVGLKAEF